jgi:hypothetical protein
MKKEELGSTQRIEVVREHRAKKKAEKNRVYSKQELK